jgi:hypothetical protein
VCGAIYIDWDFPGRHHSSLVRLENATFNKLCPPYTFNNAYHIFASPTKKSVLCMGYHPPTKKQCNLYGFKKRMCISAYMNKCSQEIVAECMRPILLYTLYYSSILTAVKTVLSNWCDFTKGPVGGDVANVLYSCSFF